MNRLERCLFHALSLITIALSASPALAQTGPAAQARITDVRASDTPVRFYSSIEIEVENMAALDPGGSLDTRELVLHLDNNPMPGLPAQLHHGREDTIVFKLRPDDLNGSDSDRESLRQAWREVLRSPKPMMPLDVGLTYRGEPVRYLGEREADREIPFNAYNRRTLIVGLVLLAAIVGALVFLAGRSDVLRDAGPPQLPPGQRRPYSLARTQMAFWTILILGTFGFLYIVTTNYQTLNQQSMILLGIAAGTALASAAIDTNKRNTVNTSLNALMPRRARTDQELAQIRDRIAGLESATGPDDGRGLPADQREALDRQREQLRLERIAEAEKAAELARLQQAVEADTSQLTQPVSESFVRDILTDKDGMTLHRFQITLWTLVLGALFVWEVWNQLVMPAFGAELLTLMGISSGTYLGFKIPERQT